jgi:hypothetical protein
MSTIIQNVGLTLGTGGVAKMTYPDGVLKPAMWSSSAGDVFPASKQETLRFIYTNFDLAITGTPVARSEVVYVAGAAGTINKFAALLNDTGTSTDVDFILLKNGSTLMSSDLTITHGTSDRVVVEGSLSSVAYVAGDVFSIQIVVNASTGAQGPYAFAEFLETLS